MFILLKIKESLFGILISIKNHKILTIYLLLFLLAGFLRFLNLGYSEYHTDEFKALVLARKHKKESIQKILLEQRKGPMQFLVGYATYFVSKDYRNELVHRIPFAFFSVFSVLLFFRFVYKYTDSLACAFFSSFYFLTNGFIAGFGRIVQYQNLNLLFNFLSLNFYLAFYKNDNSLKQDIFYSILGTFFFALSIFSHWDAVFIVPILVVLSIKKYFKRPKVLVLNVVFFVLLLIPFFVPYFKAQTKNTGNQDYFLGRIFGERGSNIDLYYNLFLLYNPYVTLPLLIFTALFSLKHIKRYFHLFLWFVVVFLLFEFFIKNPGTHIYNFLIPLFIISGIGTFAFIEFLNKKFLRRFAFFVRALLFLCFIFIYFQTFFLFVHHNPEYPFYTKKLLFLKYRSIQDITPPYMNGFYIPLFGFPHNRNWKQINEFINTQNIKNGENLKYITNEDKAFIQNYMDASYGIGGSYYAIGVKKPFNFVLDNRFSNIPNKKLIHTIERNGEVIVRIYRVDTKFQRGGQFD